jgi:hypothetical protein
MKQSFNNKAQAATELAVFGAILIFVIGSIIRTSVQAGMEQNQSLKAMRWALSQSLRGVRSENKSRDSANLLVIEDRLSPDPGQYGSLERVPMIHSGSGTFTNTIFMPLDWNEKHNISVMDVFVNGDHFAFTAARFITYTVQLDPSNVNRIQVVDETNGITKYFPRKDYGNWYPNCETTKVGGVDVTLGCPIFFSIVPANSGDFCKDDLGCDNSVVTFDQRFDLNLNFDYSDDPKGVDRAKMLWQWKPLIGLPDNFHINTDDGVYVTYDVDYDRKEETVYWVNRIPSASGIGLRLGVLDSQKGDINLTIDDQDRLGVGTSTPMDMGLQKDVSIFTLTRDGTYLQIRQGKAFNPETGDFVRSITKKDQVDVVSRMFQLSSNTGRYCPDASICGTPPDTIGDTNLHNPVEACVQSPRCDCFSNLTVSQTCFDKTTNMLFIRSRVQEQRGRKWVTQTE